MIPLLRRRWAGGLAAFFLPLVLAAAAASGAQITVGPLLELPGIDTMTVVWETDMAGTGSVIVRGPSGTEREILSPVAGTRHMATIAGLAPDTRYEYAVRADGEAIYRSRFRTLPERGPYRVVFLGDTRQNRGIIKDLFSEIGSYHPRFIVLLGDLVTWADRTDNWEQELFDPGRRLFDHTPILAITGNHEFEDDPERRMFRRFFPLPPGAPPDAMIYDLRLCGDLYVLLDFYNSRPLLPINNGIKLYRLLREASTNRDIGNVFILTHEGVISHWRLRRGDIALKPLLRIMGTYGVTAMISGHDHYYARGTTYSGVPFFITGGGGSPLRPANKYNFYALLTGRTALIESAYHFLVMDVDGRKCTFRAVSPDGTVFDKVVIKKQDGSANRPRLVIHIPGLGESLEKTEDEGH
jgi:hypothetical protein